MNFYKKKIREMQIGERIKEILNKLEMECIISCWKIDTNENYIRKLRENIFEILGNEMMISIIKDISKRISNAIVNYMDKNGFKIKRNKELEKSISMIVDESLKSLLDIRHEMITFRASVNYQVRTDNHVEGQYDHLTDWLQAEREMDRYIGKEINKSLNPCKILLDITYDQIIDKIIKVIEKVFVKGRDETEEWYETYIFKSGRYLQYYGLLNGEYSNILMKMITTGELRDDIIKGRLEEDYIHLETVVERMAEDIIKILRKDKTNNRADDLSMNEFRPVFIEVMMDILSNLYQEEQKIMSDEYDANKNYNRENIDKIAYNVHRYINHLLFPMDRKFYPKLDSITKAEIEYRPNGQGYLTVLEEFNNLQQL